MATAAVACAIVYLLFLRGDSGLARMDAAAEAQIMRTFDEMMVAAEAGDVDELFRRVAENDRGALISSGRVFFTRADALENTRASMQRLEHVKYSLNDRRVTFLSPNAALLVVSGSVTAKPNGGGEFTAPFVQTVVLTRERGEWRVLHTHQSGPSR